MLRWLISVAICLYSITSLADLPKGFVYLKDIDPTILQDIRYASDHNFVGRPIKSYQTATCILTKEAALALKNVQTELRKKNLSLKVYDCYRPVTAVEDFVNWSKEMSDQKMKAEFYPRVSKTNLFHDGYIAYHSGHSRGSTVDLTIIHPKQQQPIFRPNQKLISCIAPIQKRFHDNSIDMGTGYDCLDTIAFPMSANISREAHANRMLLRTAMITKGFEPYDKEWWHFTLKKEPFTHQYFNFPVN